MVHDGEEHAGGAAAAGLSGHGAAGTGTRSPGGPAPLTLAPRSRRRALTSGRVHQTRGAVCGSSPASSGCVSSGRDVEDPVPRSRRGRSDLGWGAVSQESFLLGPCTLLSMPSHHWRPRVAGLQHVAPPPPAAARPLHNGSAHSGARSGSVGPARRWGVCVSRMQWGSQWPPP